MQLSPEQERRAEALLIIEPKLPDSTFIFGPDSQEHSGGFNKRRQPKANSGDTSYCKEGITVHKKGFSVFMAPQPEGMGCYVIPRTGNPLLKLAGTEKSGQAGSNGSVKLGYWCPKATLTIDNKKGFSIISTHGPSEYIIAIKSTDNSDKNHYTDPPYWAPRAYEALGATGIKTFVSYGTKQRKVGQCDEDSGRKDEHGHIIYQPITATHKTYIVMPYQGTRIDKFMQTAQLSLLQKAQLMLELVLEVEKLHGEGIAHQDIKPANITVKRTVNASGQATYAPRLIDYDELEIDRKAQRWCNRTTIPFTTEVYDQCSLIEVDISALASTIYRAENNRTMDESQFYSQWSLLKKEEAEKIGICEALGQCLGEPGGQDAIKTGFTELKNQLSNYISYYRARRAKC